MGFSVDPFEKPTKPRVPGSDYTPPDNSYEPLIILHSNHDNLEGRYDPRDNLTEPLPREVPPRPARRKAAVVATILLLCAILLIALYFSIARP